MVKAFFFDLDDTLYDYTTADILAKEAVREYCLQNLSISGAVYDRQLAKAYVVAEERIGRECAAVHNRLIRYQCMLEMLKSRFSACIQDVQAVLGYTDETDDVGRRGLSGDEAAEGTGRVCGDLYEYDSRDPISENRKARNHQMDRWCCYQ